MFKLFNIFMALTMVISDWLVLIVLLKLNIWRQILENSAKIARMLDNFESQTNKLHLSKDLIDFWQTKYYIYIFV